MTRKQIGELVDSSGVQINLNDNEHIAEMVVLCKVVNFETGQVHMAMEASEGLDWMDQRGLVGSANDICSQPPEPVPDDDD